MSFKQQLSCTIMVLAFSFIGLISKAQQAGGDQNKVATQEPAKYTKLIWSDEFNKDGAPDSAKWGYELGNGPDGWGNRELEFYTNRPENSIVKDGVLKIKAIKENYQGYTFTSAKLVSTNKFVFQYGRVELSAKLPEGVGTWPAVWMMGSNVSSVGWPLCGELDIMEARGSEPNKIFGTLHYPGRCGGNADGGTTMITGASTGFHTYSMEWSPSAIKISVDGKLFHTVLNSASTSFNHDFYLIMNLAIGGFFAGAVDPAITNATFEVDYVRVYR